MIKSSPATAERLFGNNQLTFTALLQQLKLGQAIVLKTQVAYNTYRDNLTTSLTYIAKQKQQLDNSIINQAITTGSKMKQLNTAEDNSIAIQLFIKTRKKQLIQQALQLAGSSKYLAKMNKEFYYYGETLKNYKELFSDSKKAEKTGKEILNKIPAFQQFLQKNSLMAEMFGQGSSGGTFPVGSAIPGLQTRESIQAIIQNRFASAGTEGLSAFQQNIQQAKGELSKLKEKIASQLPGAGNGGGDMPDFKPVVQKSKTFTQRLELGTDMQFSHTGSLMPQTLDIGLSVGYKINDKSVIGIGGSYKLGMGSLQRIRFTNQGASARSFIDWKLKKQFYISGGFEMNYLADPRSPFNQPLQIWQKSGLIGASKKLSLKSKFFKQTKVQLLYDFLSQQHIPLSQPVLFRVGYNF